MSWVLYDFGARTAAAHSAEQLLLASRYNLDDTLQTALLKTAKDYEATLAASAGLDAARDNVQTTQKSLDIAQARVQHGVAAISDALQAQTAYAQANAEATHAQGTWKTAMGALAIDMGLHPETVTLRLQALPADTGAPPGTPPVPAHLFWRMLIALTPGSTQHVLNTWRPWPMPRRCETRGCRPYISRGNTAATPSR